MVEEATYDSTNESEGVFGAGVGDPSRVRQEYPSKRIVVWVLMEKVMGIIIIIISFIFYYYKQVKRA